jgi:hypothetical protein
LSALVARFRAPQEVVLVFLTIAFANRHAIEPYRTSNEIPFSNIPGVLALLAPDQDAAGSSQLRTFVLVQNVLLELFPVIVATRQDLCHEAVELAGGGGRLLSRRAHCQPNREQPKN